MSPRLVHLFVSSPAPGGVLACSSPWGERLPAPQVLRGAGRCRVDVTDEAGKLVAHGEVRLQNVAGQ
jgi:hypothetical protein